MFSGWKAISPGGWRGVQLQRLVRGDGREAQVEWAGAFALAVDGGTVGDFVCLPVAQAR